MNAYSQLVRVLDNIRARLLSGELDGLGELSERLIVLEKSDLARGLSAVELKDIRQRAMRNADLLGAARDAAKNIQVLLDAHKSGPELVTYSLNGETQIHRVSSKSSDKAV